MGFLTGKTAIITGAGRAVLSDGSCGSIGYGIATAFAKEGANLVITGRNVKKLAEAKNELEAKYGIRVLPVQADVCAGTDNEATVQNVVNQAVDTFGGIQVLVNNAQASASGVPLAEHTTEQFDLALYSGLYAAFYYMKACYPYLAKSKGSVINFASGAGLFGNFGQCSYAAAKEGIRGLSRVAATEWGKDGINVNVICPLAWTAKLEQFQQAYPDAFKANVKMPPMGHYANPETEIGRVCVQLAMPDFKYLSGETLTLEGGMGLRPLLLFSFFLTHAKGAVPAAQPLLCLGLIIRARRCTRSPALRPWEWRPPARSCGQGTAQQRPWHTRHSQRQNR